MGITKKESIKNGVKETVIIGTHLLSVTSKNTVTGVTSKQTVYIDHPVFLTTTTLPGQVVTQCEVCKNCKKARETYGYRLKPGTCSKCWYKIK
jgi:hypothetical protein